ncbi:MAG: tRNA threonylcarbamoyladenosine biosynthesis protein TsaB [Blastocatellia bacterium]|nr:tRNA threonylcarbamoyladenosine biosynthesis protein TsaB [Blastocatellia bacterium]
MPDSEAQLILSLETATRTGSVALTRGPRLLALRAGEAQASHSARLLSSVEEALEEAGARLSQVELFAVANGPGSFTGLRIGLATVKAFAATLNRPCIGVSTLAAVAHAAGRSLRTLAMIPAGRGEVFAQLLSIEETGEATPLGEAVHQSPERLLDSISHFTQLSFAGEGAQQHETLIKARAERLGVTVSDENANGLESVATNEKLWRISASAPELATNVAALARLRRQSGAEISAEQLRAVYVRPSDAELNAQER